MSETHAATGSGQLPPPGLDDVRLVENGTISYQSLTDHEGGDLTFRLTCLSDCVAVRLLADGRLLALRPTLFASQLCVGTLENLRGDWGAWDDVWDYDSLMTGLLGLASWQPAQDAEPTGWVRHPRTMRRRRHGDPETEEVRP